jgi:ABC-type transporter Mla subunit MlaD
MINDQERQLYNTFFIEKTAKGLPSTGVTKRIFSSSIESSRLADIGTGLASGVIAGQVNNLIHDNALEKKKLEEDKDKLTKDRIEVLKEQLSTIQKAVQIKPTTPSNEQKTSISPVVPASKPPEKTAGFIDNIISGVLLKDPKSELSQVYEKMTGAGKNVQAASQALESSTQGINHLIDKFNIATQGYKPNEKTLNQLSSSVISKMTEDLAKQGLNKKQILAKLNELGANPANIAKTYNLRLQQVIDSKINHGVDAPFLQDYLKTLDKTGKYLFHNMHDAAANITTNTAKYHEALHNSAEAANAFKSESASAIANTKKWLGGLTAAAVLPEIVSYPAWRTEAIKETNAINKALAHADKIKTLKTIAGAAAGLGALGALGVAAAYNHKTDPHNIQEELPRVMEQKPLIQEALGSSEHPVAWAKSATAPEAGVFEHGSDAWHNVSSTVKSLYQGHPKKTIAAGLASVPLAYLAHKGVKSMGGYQPLAHAIAPAHMQALENAGLQFGNKAKHAPESMLKAYGLPVAGVLAGGYLFNKLVKPKEKAAGLTPAQTGMAIRDAISNGAHYQEFLAKRPALSTPKAMAVGALAGLAAPTILSSLTKAYQSYQQAKLQNQLLQNGLVNPMMGTNLGMMDPYLQQSVALNSGAIY